MSRQCLDAGVLDEVLLLYAPVLPGEGVRVLDRPNRPRVRLEPVPGETAHWYRVR